MDPVLTLAKMHFNIVFSCTHKYPNGLSTSGFPNKGLRHVWLSPTRDLRPSDAILLVLTDRTIFGETAQLLYQDTFQMPINWLSLRMQYWSYCIL
jgi:hypothetical protein